MLLSAALAADPAVVVTTRGDVQLTTAGETAAAPAPPFALMDNQSLTVAEGALVVVLYQGAANQLRGPRSVALSELRASTEIPKEQVGVLNDLFSRELSTDKAGASRAGDLRMVRPVPGGTVLAPQTFGWRCAETCAEEDVQIYDFREDAVVWTAKGNGTVEYAGPDLGPGAYSLVVAGREFAFTVAPKSTRESAQRARAAAMAAAQSLPKDDPASVAVPATVLLQAGLASEALWLIDQALTERGESPELIEMRREFERRAGIAP
ncbi:MAG: hypothetical protein KC912_06190 [Proteobacteria bacterium]|nr:hypothetical protein [Pseudomonadota bacterium]